ncbi:urease accessory protein UreF [Planktotalea sp.]|uniref:urease accessory protein UreF n=1 Tax=Planktotalea sp. TaxID=2029877 RepID=UPI003D6BD1D8
MGARTAMPTDSEILTLAQWFSPGFPIGSFAYSHGLEWAIECGDVSDATSARAWILTALEHGSGRNDCIFLSAAFNAEKPENILEIDATCRAFAASRERMKESDLQGAAFCKVVSAIWKSEIEGLCYPIAVGRGARLQGLPLELTAQMYLHSMLSNLVAVAMRIVPLGQTEGQSIIHDLTPKMALIAKSACTASLDDVASSAFLSDIAAMKHETQYSRIFRT